MNILLISPRTPDTFWSFKHAIRFVSRKASMAPLGLLTVAAMLPPEWELKLVDMNVEKLKDEDLRWADYVLLGAMIVQKDSVREIVARCAALGKNRHRRRPAVHHRPRGVSGNPALRSGRGRGTDAASRGRPAKRTIAIHLSNVAPAGHHPHAGAALGPHQLRPLCHDVRAILARLSVRLRILRHHRDERPHAAHQNAGAIDRRTGRRCGESGWNDMVFIVDDNFIGNKVRTRTLLHALIEWRQRTRTKIGFLTEASVNLADDPEMCALMVAGRIQKSFCRH